MSTNKPTVASLAQDVAALQEGIGAIMLALQPKTEPAESAEQATVKRGARTNASRATAAKSGAIRRKLDPVVIATDDDDVSIVVAPTLASGALAKSAKVRVERDGRTVKGNLSLADVLALVEAHDEIVSAADTVEKAAKIGVYAPRTDDDES